jgi:hypothetical protein
MPEPVDVVKLRDAVLTCPACHRPHVEAMTIRPPAPWERLEAKLDAVILALKAGAVGRWQP